MSIKKKILWVDDQINRPELRPDKDEISELGYEILSAATVEEYKDIISYDTDISLIIYDLSMAVGTSGIVNINESRQGTLTGFILMKKIVEKQKQGEYRNVKLAVYTNVPSKEAVDFCRENAIPYWDKCDIMTNVLAHEIRNLLENEKES